jgi:hypothetical protein
VSARAEGGTKQSTKLGDCFALSHKSTQVLAKTFNWFALSPIKNLIKKFSYAKARSISESIHECALQGWNDDCFGMD